MFGYVAVLLLMVLTISMLFTNGFGSNTRDRRITYPQLLTMIEEGQVRLRRHPRHVAGGRDDNNNGRRRGFPRQKLRF